MEGPLNEKLQGNRGEKTHARSATRSAGAAPRACDERSLA